MKRSRFSEEQIIGILKEHQAGLSAVEICRKYGISDATFYNWRSKYGGMDVPDAKREGARGREPQVEEAHGGVDARCGDAERASRKKLLTPGARRAAVSSSTSPRRPSGFICLMRSSVAWSLPSKKSSVATGPGETALTVIRRGPNSFARI